MEVDEISQDGDVETGETWVYSDFFDIDGLAPQDQNPVSAKLEKAIFGISKNGLDRRIHAIFEEFDGDGHGLTEAKQDIRFAQIDALFDEKRELQEREFRWLRRFLIIVGFGTTWVGSAPEIDFIPSISALGNPFSGVLPFLVSRSNLILALLGVILTLMGLLFTVRTPDPLSGERTRQHLQSVKSNQNQMQDVLEQQTEFLQALQDQSQAIERIESELNDLKAELKTDEE